MSKKTLAVIGASLFFAACTNPFVMKKEVPAPMPTPVVPVSSAPATATGSMMQNSSSSAAMEKLDLEVKAGAMKK